MAMGPEDKKKVYAFGGLAGLLGIVGLIVWHPWAGSGTADTAASTSTPSTLTASAPGAGALPGSPPSAAAGSGGLSGAGSPGSEGTAGAGGAAPQLVAVAAEQFRDDPFVPFYTVPPTPLPPLPTPRPRATATPIPPVLILPIPGETRSEAATELPSIPGGNTRSTVLAGLPSARISRLVNAPTAPRVQAPPVSPGGTDASGNLERSPNKRLAGVAIGDSVRALLEVQDASSGEFRTYIVQPGQRIDAENLQVLRIERTTEGGQTRVRMIVRENGQIRVIDLREGQRPDIVTAGAGAGGEGSAAGSGGYPGGFPGGGGGYPAGGGGYPGGGGGYPGGGYPGNASPPGFPGGRPGFGGPLP